MSTANMTTDAMPLRDYQQAASDNIAQQLQDSRRTLCVMATGTGKTVLFGHVARDWECGRVMVIAHRDELIRQAAAKIGLITGETCDIEMGDERADEGFLKARVVVSSVQTQCAGPVCRSCDRDEKGIVVELCGTCMAGRHPRMLNFDPQEFGLLIIDEAHHATAATYRQLIDYYSQNPALCVLGVTATPDRADESALGQVFENVAFDYQLPDAVRDGWLVPISQQFVYVEGLDLSACRTTAGDLNAGDLEKIMLFEETLHKVVDPTMELAGDSKAIIFATSVAHSERMAEIANRHRPGCAEWISGGTDMEKRRDILRRYRSGEFQFLFNCMIATEGFDEPGIGVVAVARPTKSRALYSQMIGRGTRPLPGVVDGPATADARKLAIATSGKPELLVLDFVGNSGRHKLVSAADILGGNENEAVVELARANMNAKSTHGESADVLLELAAAREQLEEQARRRRLAVRPKAEFKTKAVNPFDLFDVIPGREPGWFKGKLPTEKMARVLKDKWDVDTTGMSYWDAKALIDKFVKRIEKGLCTPKQAKTLARFGYDHNMTFDEARRTLDSLAKNNWRRP